MESREAAAALPVLSTRGFIVLCSTVLVPVAGIIFGLAVADLILLLLAGLALFLLAAFLEYQTVRKIRSVWQIRAELDPNLYAAKQATLRIEGRTGKVSKDFIVQIKPAIPKGIQLVREQEYLECSSGQSRFSVSFDLVPLIRGPLIWHTFYCRIQPSRGLIVWQFTTWLKEPAEATVYPNAACNQNSGRHPFIMHMTGDTPLRIMRGGGREFDSLRRYTVGDDLRKVDWKRSARGSGLVVKVYRPETHQRINIAIDCSRRMGNVIDGRLQIDYAIDAAAYLIRLAQYHDDEVGLFAFHNEVLTRINPQRGVYQERLLLEQLLELQAGNLEADYQLLTEWAHFNRRRSLLLLITSVSNPAGLDAIRNSIEPIARKHRSLVTAVADRDLIGLTEEKADSVEQAYIIAAAAQQLNTIQHKLTSMQHSGIDCVYSDVLELPEMLRNKYMALKESGRL